MMRSISQAFPLILYGAAGATGRLVLDAVLARGIPVILAGRSEASLAPLAARLNLPMEAAAVEDWLALVTLAARGSIILNAAGPFAGTAAPLARACLAGGAAYVDVSGEVDTLVELAGLDADAKAAGLPLLCGAGFGVAVGECLALHVAGRLPRAASLRVGLDTRVGRRTPAAAQSAIAALGRGSYDIAGGLMRRRRFAAETWTVDHDGESFFFAGAPLAETWASARSTGVADVRGGIRTRAALVPVLKLAAAAARIAPLRRWLANRAASPNRGDGISSDAEASTAIVEAVAPDGSRSASALRIGIEAYAAAAEIAAMAIGALDEGRPIGFHTPGSAFGADFIMALGQTTRRNFA
jgi:short subunit dehydrogenase-like uncharacterized protein